MEPMLAYSHALVSIAGMVLIWAVLSPLSAIKKESAGAEAGGAPPEDYANPAYRWFRAYMNLTETMPSFLGAVGAAILAGAAPFWVNLLASIFFLSRIAVAIVHIRGIGKKSGGLRSIVYTVGWACCIALAVLAIIAVF